MTVCDFRHFLPLGKGKYHPRGENRNLGFPHMKFGGVLEWCVTTLIQNDAF